MTSPQYHRIRFKAAGAKRRTSRWAVPMTSKRPNVQCWRFCDREGDFGSHTNHKGEWVEEMDLLVAGANDAVKATPAWFCWKYGELVIKPECDMPDCPCHDPAMR